MPGHDGWWWWDVVNADRISGSSNSICISCCLLHIAMTATLIASVCQYPSCCIRCCRRKSNLENVALNPPVALSWRQENFVNITGSGKKRTGMEPYSFYCRFLPPFPRSSSSLSFHFFLSLFPSSLCHFPVPGSPPPYPATKPVGALWVPQRVRVESSRQTSSAFWVENDAPRDR